MDAGRRPHVAFLADSLVIGGAERVVQALVEDLPGEGFDVSVSCFRERGPIGHGLERAGVRVFSRLAPRRFDPAQALVVSRHLKSIGADLVHTLDHSNVLLYGRLAARMRGLPQVCAIHRTRRADGSRSLGFADRMLMPLSERAIAVSRGHAEYLNGNEGVRAESIEVIYNGVDTGSFRPVSTAEREAARRELGLESDAPVAMIVAALRPEKNHAGLLDALADVTDLHLAVVGGGDLESHLRRHAIDSGLDARVHWLGRREDVRSCLRAADFVVLPSHPAVETFPLSILEAMACALPVVVTRVGSLEEMVEHEQHGLVVEPGSRDALAAALSRMASDRESRNRMGAAARQRVQDDFTRAKMVRAHAELFRGLLAEHRREKTH